MAETVVKSEETARVEEVNETPQQNQSRKKRLMTYAIIGGVVVALLLGWALSQKGKENQQGGIIQQMMKKQYAPQFDKSGDTTNPTVQAPKESPQELLELAKRVKEAGLMIYGVTQCGWTRKQRELFGDRDSEARKIIESVYIECRSREMCPNIRGYPTWVHGTQQYPGFRDTTKIRTLVNEVNSLPVQPMLHMPSEPVDEANFDKFAVDPAPNPKQVKAADVINVKMGAAKEDLEKNKDVPAVVESSEEPKIVEIVEESTEPKVEKARGVSDYPPLNVPDMPGTAPMALAANNGPSHSGDQMVQGNVPRQAVSNPDPVKELANQVAASFNQVRDDQARSKTDSSVNRTYYHHGATISTGDAFIDKTLPVKKDN